MKMKKEHLEQIAIALLAATKKYSMFETIEDLANEYKSRGIGTIPHIRACWDLTWKDNIFDTVILPIINSYDPPLMNHHVESAFNKIVKNY